MAKPRSEILGLLDSYIDKMKKQADEAGSTSHPIGNVDNGTGPAAEGAFGKEKSEDVKAGIPAESVEDKGDLIGNDEPKGENIPKRDAEDKPDLTVKTTKDDPGTSHPSGAPEKAASVSDLAKELLAQIAVMAPKTAAEKPCEKCKNNPCTCSKTDVVPKDAAAVTSEGKQVAAEPSKEEKAAAAAGYELGQKLADQYDDSNVKMAEAIVGTAVDDAEILAKYLSGYQFGLMAKKAEVPPEVLAQLLSQQGSEGGPGAAPEAGAPESSSDESAAAPELPDVDGEGGGEAGAGGEGALAAGGEGGGVDEGTIEEIANALAASGVTPEELAQIAQQALQEEGGGAAGAVPPVPPPVDEAKVAQARQEKAAAAKLAEILTAVKTIVKAGASKKEK